MSEENWKLKQLEEEIRHEREMRALQGARIDTHDEWLTRITAVMDVISTRLELVTVDLEALAKSQLRTEERMQKLIDTLVREHTNGKGSK